MPDWNVILHLLTLALLGVGSYLLATFRTGTEAAVKTSAEEGVKAAFRDLEWSKELARELQKSRGLERQELRFKSYGALWKELRPLAIYDVATVDKKAAGNLLKKLTDWYFSECGGLLLTAQAREFYFALQDLLRATSSIPGDWKADRSAELGGKARETFLKVFETRLPKEAISVKEAISGLDYFDNMKFENWQNEAVDLGKKWSGAIKQLGAVWVELTPGERFAVLQQVGSKLRSTLVYDLESREG